MNSTTDQSLEQLLNYVAKTIDALWPALGSRMMMPDIQIYLRDHYGVQESLERIKEATDIIAELEDGDCPE